MMNFLFTFYYILSLFIFLIDESYITLDYHKLSPQFKFVFSEKMKYYCFTKLYLKLKKGDTWKCNVPFGRRCCADGEILR